MFKSWSKTRDIITVFHKPSTPGSVRVLNLLKQASAEASETATIDQAGDHSGQQQRVTRDSFDLDVVETAPTRDQMKNIWDYLGAKGTGNLVRGASSESEAVKKVAENGDNFVRPVVVDWSNGRAYAGESESEILKLLNQK